MQIAARKIVKKDQKKSLKMPSLPFGSSGVAYAERVNYKNNTKISDVSSNKSAQVAAKKIVKKYKKNSLKMPSLPFGITGVAYAERVNYKNDTKISDVSSNKSAQVAAKKLLKNTEI